MNYEGVCRTAPATQLNTRHWVSGPPKWIEILWMVNAEMEGSFNSENLMV